MRKFLAVAMLSFFVAGAAGVAAAEAPKRVLSVGVAATETVFALGAGDALVGIDQSSVFPREKTKALPNVGYVRALSAEGLLSLKADVMIAGPEAGPPAALDQAEAAGLHIVRLHEGYTPEEAVARIREIGKALGREAQAESVANTLSDDLATVKMAVAAAKTHPRVLFVLQAGRGAPMAAGAGTAADAMIGLAGGVSAVGQIKGYKPLSPEAAAAAAPNIIVMMKDTVDAIGGENAVYAMPEIAQTPAARERRLVVVDGTYSLSFGPRLAHALRDLAASFHPEAKFPVLPEREWTRLQ
ncbi:ABC transporter substrate-binding protein [Parvibaculum sp.]|uniref:heme/hemin ABC transporter substrate-binding protein n=1 Tax=Parvibaculum sp. TaxID=2024848 RepID=UPI00320F8DCF